MMEYVIDFSKKNQLNESWLRMFGMGIDAILRAMFVGSSIPVKIKGSNQDVRSFARVLAGEKKYFDAYSKHGLDNPKTLNNKYLLDRAIKNFEKETGLEYPFK